MLFLKFFWSQDLVAASVPWKTVFTEFFFPVSFPGPPAESCHHKREMELNWPHTADPKDHPDTSPPASVADATWAPGRTCTFTALSFPWRSGSLWVDSMGVEVGEAVAWMPPQVTPGNYYRGDAASPTSRPLGLWVEKGWQTRRRVHHGLRASRSSESQARVNPVPKWHARARRKPMSPPLGLFPEKPRFPGVNW